MGKREGEEEGEEEEVGRRMIWQMTPALAPMTVKQHGDANNAGSWFKIVFLDWGFVRNFTIKPWDGMAN